MLYAGSSWSELPLSTTKQQEPNGAVFDIDFLIDQILINGTDIDTQKRFNLKMDTKFNFNLDVAASLSNVFFIDQQREFTLEIDENNTWDLS